MTKALVMFSGGLDSLLAAKVLESQGIDVTCLCFVTPFFGKEKAEKIAKANNLKLVTKEISESHLEVVKNPQYGYGKNMNPCKDCHGFMFRIAKEIAKKEDYQIIASGEVLGQRPMSQNKNALVLVQKLAGCDVLRPLSAKLLEETSYEKEGLVDRSKLEELSGRGRQGQMELIKKLGIKVYENSGGGCLLTAIEYSKKLKKILELFGNKVRPIDTEIIKHGRFEIFEIEGKSYLAMNGREKADNEKLWEIFQALDENYYFFKLDFPGPHLLLATFGGEISEELKKKIALFLQSKTKKAKEEKVLNLRIFNGGEEEVKKVEN